MGTLEGVKVGDTLALRISSGGWTERVVDVIGLKVAAVFKKYVETGDEGSCARGVEKWRIRDGALVGGDSLRSPSVEPWTMEHALEGQRARTAERRRRKAKKLEAANWDELPPDVVDRCYGIVFTPGAVDDGGAPL